jgi:hypothetical protein
MEPHQSMEQQQRESVLLSKPQQLQQQNVVEEEEKVPRPHRCNDRLEDIVQVIHTPSLSLCLSVSLSSGVFASALGFIPKERE